MIRVSFFY